MRAHLLRQRNRATPCGVLGVRLGRATVPLPRIWSLLVATGAAFTMLAPAFVEACATCISSPYGDRTYNWPYLVLILLPFAVTTVIGAVMMRVTGARLSDLRPWLARIIHPENHPEARQEGFGAPSQEETT